jgi:hypothetical protein
MFIFEPHFGGLPVGSREPLQVFYDKCNCERRGQLPVATILNNCMGVAVFHCGLAARGDMTVSRAETPHRAPPSALVLRRPRGRIKRHHCLQLF